MKILSSIRAEIRGLKNYVAGEMPLKSKVDKQIKLASNENLFGSSPRALAAIEEEIKKGLSIYPDSKMKALKNGVSDYWIKRNTRIYPENLIFGDSSGEVLNMLLAAFLKDGDSIVIPEKSFSLYSLLAIPKGAKVIEAARDDFQVSINALIQAVKKEKNVKMVILSNPDNPTSTFLFPDEIEKLLKNVPEETVVLVDEAYIDFAGKENSSIKWLQNFPNLILIYTFSKAYGLAGLRVGYAVMVPELASQIEKIRLPFNLGTLQQKGAIAALEDEEFVENVVEQIHIGRNYLERELRNLGIWQLPSAGNFIFADFGEKHALIRNFLEENGISVRTLSSFGYPENYVRITIGRKEDNEYFIEKLKEIV
jgi:histidinol-phosphate aminotransferase